MHSSTIFLFTVCSYFKITSASAVVWCAKRQLSKAPVNTEPQSFFQTYCGVSCDQLSQWFVLWTIW